MISPATFPLKKRKHPIIMMIIFIKRKLIKSVQDMHMDGCCYITQTSHDVMLQNVAAHNVRVPKRTVFKT
jgi:hypothetical protein